jgi:pyruvate dehydrogenase (quinone)
MLGLNGIGTMTLRRSASYGGRLSARRPTVFEVVCDPELPPLPAHITIEQARSLTKAVMHSDSSRRRIIAQ